MKLTLLTYFCCGNATVEVQLVLGSKKGLFQENNLVLVTLVKSAAGNGTRWDLMGLDGTRWDSPYKVWRLLILFTAPLPCLLSSVYRVHKASPVGQQESRWSGFVFNRLSPGLCSKLQLKMQWRIVLRAGHRQTCGTLRSHSM